MHVKSCCRTQKIQSNRSITRKRDTRPILGENMFKWRHSFRVTKIFFESQQERAKHRQWNDCASAGFPYSILNSNGASSNIVLVTRRFVQLTHKKLPLLWIWYLRLEIVYVSCFCHIPLVQDLRSSTRPFFTFTMLLRSLTNSYGFSRAPPFVFGVFSSHR